MIIAERSIDSNTVALSDTVSQTNAAVVKILDAKTIKEFRHNYYVKHGEWPSEDEDITKEQLTALFTMLTVIDSPYCDFALWVAFWYRFIKRKRFMGTVVNEFGEVIVVELLGPPNYDSWASSYTCFMTGADMIKFIDHGKLVRYMKRIRSWAKQYPHCWGLIYQADVRMRSERCHRIREASRRT